MDLATALIIAGVTVQSFDLGLTYQGIKTSNGRCVERTLTGHHIRNPEAVLLLEGPAIVVSGVFNWKLKRTHKRWAAVLSGAVLAAGVYGVRTNLKNYTRCHR